MIVFHYVLRICFSKTVPWWLYIINLCSYQHLSERFAII